MQNSWIVLLPPLIVLILAFTTRKVLLSLFFGIITASLILNNLDLRASLSTIIEKIWAKSEIASLFSWDAFKNNWGLFIFLFLIILGIIIVLVNHSGGAYAYGNFIEKKLKTKKTAELSSLALSTVFFMDDSFSCLTVGSVMHHLTDKFKIARVKLAFLVNCMAPTLAILAPISSWAAYIVMQFQHAGINNIALKGTYILADPYLLYLKTIPFIFYPIIMIVMSWAIVENNFSIGLMRKQEKIAKKTGNLYGGKDPIERKTGEINEDNIENASMVDFLLPIASLIFFVISSMLYTGGFWIFGGQNSLAQAFRNSKSTVSLFTGGLITLIITVIFYLIRKKLKCRELFSTFKSGFDLMKSSILVLILAWALGDLLKDDLLTGQYLAGILLGHINIIFLPVMFFFASAAISFTMGSAWGCLAVMIPIAVPMMISFLHVQAPLDALNLSLLFPNFSIIIPTLGAILSGAVSGNHTSPIADTTVLSAASSGCYHIDHVRTLHTYSIPTLICTGFAFLISGLLDHTTIDLGLNALISISFGLLFNSMYIKIRVYFSK